MYRSIAWNFLTPCTKLIRNICQMKIYHSYGLVAFSSDLTKKIEFAKQAEDDLNRRL